MEFEQIIERRTKELLAVPEPRVQGVPAHGTYSTYLTYGCRCEPCTLANAKSKAAWRVKARERFGHGTERGRAVGCRCKLCIPPKAKKKPSATVRKKK